MDIAITTMAQRPELTQAFWALPNSWPAFVLEDRVGWFHYPRILTDFPEFVLLATDESGAMVARCLAVPFALHAPGRGSLPDGGWDQALMWAFSDLRAGRTPDTMCAIEITVGTPWQGQGLASAMLLAMRDNAARLGFDRLVAPLRPTLKHLEPHTPIGDYGRRRREDGLPWDPWMRTHVRAGAVVTGVASTSMVVVGTLREWRGWTGLAFDASGPVEVPHALAPVHCDVDNDHAVYVEPNIWVEHDPRA